MLKMFREIKEGLEEKKKPLKNQKVKKKRQGKREKELKDTIMEIKRVVTE